MGNDKELEKKAHGHCGPDCECDHHHDYEEMDSIILTLDDDSELECKVIGIYELDDERSYISLLTLEDEQILLYRYNEDPDNPDEFTLDSISSEEEFQEASDAFYELFLIPQEEDEE